MAVVLSVPDHVEGILVDGVRVDGMDSGDTILEMMRRSPFLPSVRAVLLDGVAFGGFNIVDLGKLSRRLHRPVVAVTRRPPDFDRIRKAIWKYFPEDRRRRWARLRKHPLFPCETAGEPLWIACAGCTRAEARSLVQRTAVRGYWPEPLRLAHLVGHAIGASRRTLKGRTTVQSSGL